MGAATKQHGVSFKLESGMLLTKELNVYGYATVDHSFTQRIDSRLGLGFEFKF